jgi:sugar lactone lactonase YvrE
MHGQAVYVLEDDGPRKVADVPGTPAGLGWLPDGSLLVVSQQQRIVYRVESGGLAVHADLSGSVDSALNDMWVLPDGRAYVGEMGFDVHAFLEAAAEGRTDGPAFAFGRVFVVEPDGSHRPACDSELMFPNGIVSGPHDQLLVAESFGFKVTAFRIAADGSLTEPRLWAELGFAPDGLSLAPDGRLWVADPAGKRAVLVAEGGAELDEVPTADGCLSVALGGPTGDDLYLCTTPETHPHRAVALAGSHVEVATVSRTD